MIPTVCTWKIFLAGKSTVSHGQVIVNAGDSERKLSFQVVMDADDSERRLSFPLQRHIFYWIVMHMQPGNRFSLCVNFGKLYFFSFILWAGWKFVNVVFTFVSEYHYDEKYVNFC